MFLSPPILYSPLVLADAADVPTELVGGVGVCAALGSAQIIGVGPRSANVPCASFGTCTGLGAIVGTTEVVAIGASIATASLVDGALAFEGAVGVSASVGSCGLIDANGGTFVGGVGWSSSLGFAEAGALVDGTATPPQRAGSAGAGGRRHSRVMLVR